MSGSHASTRGIEVQVSARYVPERSEPKQGVWLFAYTVRIANHGDERVQLLSRHWIITDAHGRVHEVRGEGVVGEKPVLDPGEAFEYTSQCPLPTAFGTMEGTYQMTTASGESFEAAIARFGLAEPTAIN